MKAGEGVRSGNATAFRTRREGRAIIRRSGFTIVELIVVVAILTLLAGIVIPVVSGEADPEDVKRAEAGMRRAAAALRACRADLGAWPEPAGGWPSGGRPVAIGDVVPLFRNAAAAPAWRGPYLRAPAPAGGPDDRLDPWGQPLLVVAVPGTGGSPETFLVLSTGPDGALDSKPRALLGRRAAGDDLMIPAGRP